MNPRTKKMRHAYQSALSHYMADGSAAHLLSAPCLGRQCVSLNLETLQLALIHEEALLAQVLPVSSLAVRKRLIRRANRFFAEAILPLEKGHRLALETNRQLSELNRSLTRRSLDLAAANRRLKSEIVRRHEVESSLRKSEQQSSRLLRQSHRMQEQLRSLSRRILTVQEEERKRISRELHDVISQVLVGINVRLAGLKTEASINTKDLTRNIARTQKLVEKSVDIVHQFASDLRPAALDHLGLIPALHSLMKRFTKETGIRVSLVSFAGVDAIDVSRRTILYRVTQESLTNVARHARATQVKVILARLPGAVSLSISDDGRAFDASRTLASRKSRRMGLIGMRERVEMVGGTFAVDSTPGKGTTIRAQIPFVEKRKEGK